MKRAIKTFLVFVIILALIGAAIGFVATMAWVERAHHELCALIWIIAMTSALIALSYCLVRWHEGG